MDFALFAGSAGSRTIVGVLAVIWGGAEGIQGFPELLGIQFLAVQYLINRDVFERATMASVVGRGMDL